MAQDRRGAEEKAEAEASEVKGFATKAEIRRLTGTDDPDEQIRQLRAHGLYPFINQETREPVIYREALLERMLNPSPPIESTFTMNDAAFS